MGKNIVFYNLQFIKGKIILKKFYFHYHKKLTKNLKYILGIYLKK